MSTVQKLEVVAENFC